MMAGLLFGGIAIAIFFGIYLFYCYSFYRIGKKFEIGSFWQYCVPLYNMILICRCGGVSGWNVIGLFIPLLNIYCMIHIWGSVAQRLGKSYWLYGIVTWLAFITVIILAFDNSVPEGYLLSGLDAEQEGTSESIRKAMRQSPKKADFLSSFGFGSVSQLVGVDIGTSSIKVCSLKPARGGFVLDNIVVRSYENDLLSDGNIIDISFLSQELKNIFSQNKIKSKNVACALSSYTVITKKIIVPFLDEEELENSITLEVENVIPFPLNDIYHSYCVMGVDEEKQDMTDIQIVAAKREIVDGYMKVFSTAGLNLHILDVDIFAVTNLIEQIYNPGDVAVIAIDVGASVTNIAIIKGPNIEFTREILMGGRYLTSQIEKTLRVSYKDAEQRKTADHGELSYLFEDFIFNVASEITKTINFYTATKPKEAIGRIYLTGGSSLLAGLKEKIAEDTRIEVEYLDPFLLLSDEPAKLSAYEEYKQFVAVALYLSSRITDLGS
jgi:type IV pilus assembly protein PilM